MNSLSHECSVLSLGHASLAVEQAEYPVGGKIVWLLPEPSSGLVATPSPGFRFLNDPRSYGVQYHIPTEFKKVILFFYKNRFDRP